jgi:single-stranded DNA-binding protein
MVDTNYVGSLVKIIETPINKVLNEQISTTQFRVQLPQVRKNRIINLIFWGSLARDVAKYYQINDYIMIEGYLSVRGKAQNKIKSSKQNLKKAQITVSKIYPFSLTLNK